MAKRGIETGWIEFFQAGTHAGMSGKPRTYTKGWIDRVMIGKFNPNRRDQPAVIGHPDTNSPAWGWVSDLKRKGRRVFARFDRTDPWFFRAVKGGRFPKRSAKVHPTKGLIHVGFLGAVPPAIKGMQEIHGSRDGETVTFSFSEGNMKKDNKKLQKALENIQDQIDEITSQEGAEGEAFAALKDGFDEAIKLQNKAHKREVSGLKKEIKTLTKAKEKAEAFSAPGASKKRKKKRKKGVSGLVKNKSILPADAERVEVFATALTAFGPVEIDGKQIDDLGAELIKGIKSRKHPIYEEFAVSVDDDKPNPKKTGDLALAQQIAGAKEDDK